MIAKARN